MSPQRLLACVAAAYAGCATYRDKGVTATRVTTREDSPRTTKRPFSTAFARPDRLRFESRDRVGDADPWERFIVWARGDDVRTWWDVVPIVDYSGSVEEALTRATGVSGSAAHAVPALLLPGVVGSRRLTDLARGLSVEDDRLGETRCYRLSGRFLPNPVEKTRPGGRRSSRRRNGSRATGSGRR